MIMNVYTKLKKQTAVLISLLAPFTFCALHADGRISTQAHEDTVTTIAALESSSSADSSFYSAGEDGFVIKWNSDNTGEHYQISELPIQLIARNPNGNEIAVYESDGVSINRVSVWDWKTLTRKYAKRFSDSVTSLAYSERGTYLIVGTAALNGVYFFNASNGSNMRKATNCPALVSYIKTGASEKTAILYSPTGTLVYYDIENAKQKAKFTTESSLDQPLLFGTGDTENQFFAGTKNGLIYIIYALSGKTIAQYAARKALIFASDATDEKGMYFTSYDGKDYTLRMVTNEMLQTQKKSIASAITPPAALVIKTFTGPKDSDGFTTAAKNLSTILFGTKQGNIYSMNDVPEAEKLTLFPISEKLYERVYDISSDGTDFYFLTKNSIYKSSYENELVERDGSNNGQKNCIKYKSGVILWSKDTKKSVQYLPLSSNGTALPETLFTPINNLQNVRLFGNKIVYIQGNSSVGIFDMDSRQNTEVYSGTALQDAVLYNDTDLYVAKTAAVTPKTSLVQVNISTKETVPLKISGTIAYSLSYDNSRANSPIYGITVTSSDTGFVTKVFSFDPANLVLTNLLQLSDEDPNAFTSLNYPMLYTNIGKSNVRSYNLDSRVNFQYARSASMPVKIACSQSMTAILNRDGSVSWYNSDSPNLLADWYLTVNGDWYK